MIFDNDDGNSITAWYPLLNWNGLPNFGSFHTATCKNEFDKNYYRAKEIVKLYNNICETLKNKHSAANIRLSGSPGAGKTSFLYAIKKISERNESDCILSDFYIYIFHINRADDEDGYKEEIIHNIKKAWKGFYSVCNESDQYDRFEGQKLSNKEMINKLGEYYIENKGSFQKIMIFAVDDVDLLPGEHVSNIVDIVLRNMEIGSVKKWLVIRNNTFDNYVASTKIKIEQFFPDPYPYPNISLHELIKFRIKNIVDDKSMTCKNPFSEDLCDEKIIGICEGNMREGLSLLKSILEENLPGSFMNSTDEKVIQNYLDNCAIKTLMSSQKLIDLHSSMFRFTTFPIAIDVLACSVFHTSIDLLFAGVNDCLLKRNINSGHVVGGKDKEFRLRKADFDNVLFQLAEHGLIDFDKNKNKNQNLVKITNKGVITALACVGDYYFEFSKEKNKLSIDDDTYWKLAKKKVDHKKIMDLNQVWRKRHE